MKNIRMEKIGDKCNEVSSCSQPRQAEIEFEYFGNSLSSSSGNIIDCHQSQSKATGIVPEMLEVHSIRLAP
jgi:hypothetical protein